MAFNQRKTSQMAAWLLINSGRQLEVLKLIKLLYLSEREALIKYGSPMSGDRLVSMPHGPVLSQTLDLINGGLRSVEGGWDSWIVDRAGRMVALRDEVTVRRESLDQLSDADIRTMDEVLSRYGEMTAWQLREYTHEHCPEWVDPKGSSSPISYENLFRVAGMDAQAAGALADEIVSDDEIDLVFARHG